MDGQILPPGKAGRIREHPSPSVPVWSQHDYPHFEANGKFVHVVAIDGRQLLVERTLAEAWGKCGQPLGEPHEHPMSRADLAATWLMFFLLGVCSAIAMLRGAWPW